MKESKYKKELIGAVNRYDRKAELTDNIEEAKQTQEDYELLMTFIDNRI